MRTLLTRVVQPIILYLIYAAVVTLLVPDDFRNLQSALLLIGIVRLVSRWGLFVARWMYDTRQMYVAAYLLVDFVMSARILFFVGLTGYAFLTDGSWIARFLIGISILLSLIRFFGALRHLVKNGTLLRNVSFWWRSLWDEETLEANRAFREELLNTPDPTSEQLALSIFRDLIVDGSSTKPARGTPIPQRRRRWFGRTEVSSEGVGFLAQARLNADRTRAAAPFVPFLQYWPTYDHMTQAQQAWYFYWRTELRKGNNLPTSISYILVHAYELINLIGVSSPQDGFDQLVRLWQHYRDEHPDLDDYLVNWCADLLIVHQLPMQALDWYAQIVPLDCLPRGDDDLLLEAWVHGGGDFDQLNMDFLYQISGYSPQRNKFYQAYHKEINFEEAFKRSLSAIDDHLRKNGEQGLFLMHDVGAPAWYSREPFAEAIHDYPIYGKVDVAEVRRWTASAELTQTLASIIRQAENILRKEENFRAQLRDVTVPQGWEEIIRAAIVAPPPERKVEIDLAHADLIRQESETIRQRLIVEEDVEEEAEVEGQAVVPNQYRADRTQILAQPDPQVERDSSLTEISTAPDNDTSTLPLDAEWIEFADQLQAKHWRALLVVSEAQDVNSKLDALARSVHSTANQLIDQINEFGLETIDDTIIETAETIPSVIDEYTQSVETLLKWAVQQQKMEAAP